MNISTECPLCGGKCTIEQSTNVIVCRECKWRFCSPKAMQKPRPKVLTEFARRPVLVVNEPDNGVGT